MCIIVYKPNCSKFPVKKTLKNCFTNNDDGAGYMFAVNNRVYIRKGFMTFKEFWKDLQCTKKKYGEEIPCVMHFRISTQAGVDPTITHPYPLSDRLKELKMLRTSAKVGIAHNGIIDLTTDVRVTDRNDTMSFVMDFLTLIIDNNPQWYAHNDKKLLIERLIGTHNKLAILSNDGHCELIGDFHANTDGCYYSNYSYAYSIANYKAPIYNYNDGYEFDEEDDYVKYDNMWNERDKCYDFNKATCPLQVYGDGSWCCDCRHKDNCEEFILI